MGGYWSSPEEREPLNKNYPDSSHPRPMITKEMLERVELKRPEVIEKMEPVSYLEAAISSAINRRRFAIHPSEYNKCN